MRGVIGEHELQAVAITGQYGSTVPVGHDGAASGPCLMWPTRSPRQITHGAIGPNGHERVLRSDLDRDRCAHGTAPRARRLPRAAVHGRGAGDSSVDVPPRVSYRWSPRVRASLRRRAGGAGGTRSEPAARADRDREHPRHGVARGGGRALDRCWCAGRGGHPRSSYGVPRLGRARARSRPPGAQLHVVDGPVRAAAPSRCRPADHDRAGNQRRAPPDREQPASRGHRARLAGESAARSVGRARARRPPRARRGCIRRAAGRARRDVRAVAERRAHAAQRQPAARRPDRPDSHERSRRDRARRARGNRLQLAAPARQPPRPHGPRARTRSR